MASRSDPLPPPPPAGSSRDRDTPLADLHRPVVSVGVVLTTFNHARFLGEAIGSVLTQDRLPDEIVVIDDGSADNPAAVAAKYPQLRLIRQENQGLAAARNAGLRALGSDAVVFLDADDRLLPNALADGLACLAGAPASGLVYGGHRRTDENWHPLGGDNFHATAAPYIDLLKINFIGMHAAAMYRRDALRDLGGFDPSLARCEDYDAFLRVAKAHPIASHPNVVAEYRIHGANMSTNERQMLRWALKVQSDQWRYAVALPGGAQAWREGRANWRRYYAEEALARARRDWSRPKGRSRAMRTFLEGSLMSPHLAGRVIVDSVRGSLREALPPALLQRVRQWRERKHSEG